MERVVWFNSRAVSSTGLSTNWLEVKADRHQMVKDNLAELGIVETLCRIDHDLASFEAWCKIQALRSCSASEYRSFIEAELRSEGHRVKSVTAMGELVAEAVKEVKEKSYAEYCQAVADAIAIDDKRAEALDQSKSRTVEEQNQLTKHTIEKKYGVEVTPELVEQDDNGLYGQLKLYYYLTLGNTYLIPNERKEIEHQTKETDGKLFVRELRGKKAAKVALLKKLDVDFLFDQEATRRSSDKEMEAFKQRAIKLGKEIKRHLGITINFRHSAIAIANQILKAMGRKLTVVGRVDNKKERVYKIDPLSQLHIRIMGVWLSLEENQIQPFHIDLYKGMAGSGDDEEF